MSESFDEIVKRIQKDFEHPQFHHDLHYQFEKVFDRHPGDVKEMRRRFAEAYNLLKHDSRWQELERKLKDHPKACHAVKNVISMGLSSLRRLLGELPKRHLFKPRELENAEVQFKLHRFTKLASIVRLAETVSEPGERITVYCQDPEFEHADHVDEHFLEHLHIEPSLADGVGNVEEMIDAGTMWWQELFAKDWPRQVLEQQPAVIFMIAPSPMLKGTAGEIREMVKKHYQQIAEIGEHGDPQRQITAEEIKAMIDADDEPDDEDRDKILRALDGKVLYIHKKWL